MPGTSDEKGTGADPTTDDIREEVQQKISKFGLTVDSVQKVDFRTNPIIQKIFKDIDWSLCVPILAVHVESHFYSVS